MKTPGAPAASLMHTLRSRRRLPLFVLLVLVLQALAPAWLATARAEPLTTVLCTAEGVRHVMVVDTGARAGRTAARQLSLLRRALAAAAARVVRRAPRHGARVRRGAAVRYAGSGRFAARRRCASLARASRPTLIVLLR